MSAYYRWALTAVLAFLQACTFNHTVDTTQSVLADLRLTESVNAQSNQQWVVSRNTSWFVAVPVSAPNVEQDQALAQSLAAAMRQEFAFVSVAPKSASLQDALRQARNEQASFMLYPKQLYRGDGAYSVEEWVTGDDSKAFGRDQVGVQLMVFDVGAGRLVDTVKVERKESIVPGLAQGQTDIYRIGFEQFARAIVYRQLEQPR